MIDHYRKRWIIEDYFRTLKSAGFHLKDADIANLLGMVAAVYFGQVEGHGDACCNQPGFIGGQSRDDLPRDLCDR